MIRLAVIGTNWITDKFIEAALQTGQFELSAVYSRHEDSAKIFAQKYMLTTIFTSLEQLAKSPDIDAVYIASPNSLHFEQAKLMLENGKDVICEKPLTSNIEQTKILIKIAKQQQQIIFEALKSYYLPNFERVKQYLPKLGKIRKVCLNYCQYSSRYPLYLAGENPNTFNPAFSNGSVMDIGIYPLNFAIALWGAPNGVSADALRLPSGVDGHGTILMRYNDFDVVILHSKVSNSYLPSEIQGEEGALIIDHLSVAEKVCYQPRDGELQNITLAQNDNQMYYEALKFAELIKQRQINHMGLNNSLISSQLLTEIRQQTGIIFPVDKFQSIS
ncbi:Gfo/Idh/MocA family oxidoreductase [Orbus wheelerorum]|uniref:Gfo/Idh/MocA family protein n=1 Tax=Orbus wheelerorum TaxID=3074111 RepID=UPI00370CFDE4